MSHASLEIETEKATSALLKTAFKACDIREQLAEILGILCGISWLKVAHKGAIFLANGNDELVMVAQQEMAPPLLEKCARINIGTCLCGLAAQKQKIIFSSCVDEHHVIQYPSMQPHGHYNIPLLDNDNLLGVIVLYVPHGHKPQEKEAAFMEMLGNTVSGIIAKRNLEEEIKISHFEIEESRTDTIHRLLSASEFRDTETGMHIKRMTEYAVAIGQQINMGEKQLGLLRMGAPMHDVGKIGIPDAILLKPGALNEAEFYVMKTHAALGAALLKGHTEYLRASSTIALTHHEKWDGSGYPNGSRGEDIPLFGRICAIADVFDALTSERPYKRAWETEEAIRYIEDEAGKHFDPALVEAFMGCRESILKIKALYRDNVTNQKQQFMADIQGKVTGWLSWDESLSVGIDLIDAQHQYLMVIANTMHSKTVSGEGAGAVIPAINKMIDFADIHFIYEQEIMDDYRYQYSTEHKQLHQSFMDKPQYFYAGIKRFPLLLGNEIAHFLRDWITDHIRVIRASSAGGLVD